MQDKLKAYSMQMVIWANILAYVDVALAYHLTVIGDAFIREDAIIHYLLY